MGGSIGYQIFDTEKAWDDHEKAIMTLLKLPKPGCLGYREKWKHLTLPKWAGTVEGKLVAATSTLTDQECLPYYDRNNLFTAAYMDDPVNGWVHAT